MIKTYCTERAELVDQVSMAINENEEITINCAVPIFLRWTFNGNDLLQNANNHVFTLGNVLILKPAHIEDSGIYLCQGYDHEHHLLNITYVLYIAGMYTE